MNTCKHLKLFIISDILSAYLTYCKGGYSVSYGRLLNSRGGRQEAATASRHGDASSQREEDARVQDWGIVAYQPERATEVPCRAAQQENRSTLNSSATPRLYARRFSGHKHITLSGVTLSQLSHANLLSARCYRLACLL